MRRSPSHGAYPHLTPAAFIILLVVAASGCSGSASTTELAAPAAEQVDATVEVVFLQMNDVYEITPVAGGKAGGLARVATVRGALVDENPNTVTVLAGDFLSPSALGTARVDGERLAGRHMVDVLNTLGVDLVTLGNHEFDLSQQALASRIEESSFEYVAGNVLDEQGRSLAGVIPYKIMGFRGESGHSFRLAVLGLTAALVPADYVTYLDHIELVRKQIAMLKDSADVFVALTHLFLAQDIQLADEAPELSLIMGGHEHENVYMRRGHGMTPIAKADANARSVFVHRLRYDVASRMTDVESHIVLITDAIQDHPGTASVVESWLDRAWEGFRSAGFDPVAPVAELKVALDGRESSVRRNPTRLTRLISAGMRRAAGDVDLAMYNSGSIRIDDVIPPGQVSQYDVIRILPFGGEVFTVEMSGSLLDSVLTQGLKNAGSGGFLQTDGVREEGGIWFTDKGAILPGSTYRVAVNDFLVSGRETNLGYFSLDNPNVRQVGSHSDIRFAVIEELRRQYPLVLEPTILR